MVLTRTIYFYFLQADNLDDLTLVKSFCSFSDSAGHFTFMPTRFFFANFNSGTQETGRFYFSHISFTYIRRKEISLCTPVWIIFLKESVPYSVLHKFL